MVTNINLAAPESEKKVSLTGKSSLIFSVLLLVAAIAVYAALSFLSNYYLGQKKQVEKQIQAENDKISGSEYSGMVDFQERLGLIEKILADHASFDGYVKNFSKYILPEVRLTSFEWKSEGSEIAVSGVATNFDTLSKELILLKNSPIVQAVEFKSATESSGTEGQSGVKFDLTTKIKKEALNK